MTAATMENRASDQCQVLNLPITNGLISLRALSPQRLRFELEYALERGSTANSFLFDAGVDSHGTEKPAVLVHPPGGAYADVFLPALAEALPEDCDTLQVVVGHVNPNRVALLYDSFQHRGVNGLHHAMVFEVLGDNLLSLIKATKYKGLAMPLVRSVASAVLLALDHLHARLRIIHTDLKPENILCTLHPQQVQAVVDAARVQLEAPEAQGGLPADPAADGLSAQLGARCTIGEAGGAAQHGAGPGTAGSWTTTLSPARSKQVGRDKCRAVRVECLFRHDGRDGQ